MLDQKIERLIEEAIQKIDNLLEESLFQKSKKERRRDTIECMGKKIPIKIHFELYTNKKPNSKQEKIASTYNQFIKQNHLKIRQKLTKYCKDNFNVNIVKPNECFKPQYVWIGAAGDWAISLDNKKDPENNVMVYIKNGKISIRRDDEIL